MAEPNANRELARAINRFEAGKETDEDRHLISGAAQSCEAWFDQRKLTTEKLGPVFMDALKGYLRTSRAGGMSNKDSDAVEAVMANFVDIGALANVVHPFLEGVKAGLVLPEGWAIRRSSTTQVVYFDIGEEDDDDAIEAVVREKIPDAARVDVLDTDSRLVDVVDEKIVWQRYAVVLIEGHSPRAERQSDAATA